MDPVLVLRPALFMDRAAILDLSRDIWDGEDYLHYVVDDWLKDIQGLFIVGEYGQRLAAVAKASRLLEGTWWFEGLRVHPDFERRGIATQVMQYLSQSVEKQGAHVMRLATSSERIAVHKICARMGWKKTAEVTPFRASGLQDGREAPFSVLPVQEVEQACRLAQGWQDSEYFHLLMDLGWQWVEINSFHLKQAAAEGRAWWWHGRQGLLSIWYDDEEGYHIVRVGLLACSPENLPAILLDYRRLVARLGRPEAGGQFALKPAMLAAAERAGFMRSWDKSLYIFEKIIK